VDQHAKRTADVSMVPFAGLQGSVETGSRTSRLRILAGEGLQAPACPASCTSP